MADCATCNTTQGLAVCLFCGRSFCSNHRADSNGVPACTGCLQVEKARSDRIRELSLVGANESRTKRAPSDRADANGVGHGGQSVAGEAELRIATPPPAAEPDPPLLAPLLLALTAGVPTCLYLEQLLRWVAREEKLPEWTPLAGALAGTGFVLFAVWVIARSRLSR